VAAWPSLDEVRAFLRVTDPAEDPVIQTALDAALDYGERRTDHVFDPATDGGDDPDVPGTVHHAALIHAARLYRRRDSTDGTIGFGDAGVVRIGRTDPDIEALYGAVGPMVVG
jgi:hypothetical protein